MWLQMNVNIIDKFVALTKEKNNTSVSASN